VPSQERFITEGEATKTTTMNRKIVLTSLVASALAAVATTQAAGPAFIRPTVAYVMPDADGYDDAAYLGVAAGATVGQTSQHEFSGEIGATGWEFEERFGSTWIEGTETYVPFLANYRYYAQPADAKVRLYFGPSIGFTQARYEIEVRSPGFFGKDDSTEILFTFAANIGVDIQLTEKLSLNVGYRYLYIDGGETELFGADIDLDESNAHAITAGLNIRF
jgi:opacity protein-like surface antigen